MESIQLVRHTCRVQACRRVTLFRPIISSYHRIRKDLNQVAFNCSESNRVGAMPSSTIISIKSSYQKRHNSTHNLKPLFYLLYTQFFSDVADEENQTKFYQNSISRVFSRVSNLKCVSHCFDVALLPIYHLVTAFSERFSNVYCWR